MDDSRIRNKTVWFSLKTAQCGRGINGLNLNYFTLFLTKGPDNHTLNSDTYPCSRHRGFVSINCDTNASPRVALGV